MQKSKTTTSANQINDVQKEILLILSRQKNALSSKAIFAVCDVAVHINAVAQACHKLAERHYVAKLTDVAEGRVSGPNLYAISDAGRALLVAMRQPNGDKVPSPIVTRSRPMSSQKAIAPVVPEASEGQGTAKQKSKVPSTSVALPVSIAPTVADLAADEKTEALLPIGDVHRYMKTALTDNECAAINEINTAVSLSAVDNIQSQTTEANSIEHRLLSVDEINMAASDAAEDDAIANEATPPGFNVADKDLFDDEGLHYVINAAQLARILESAPLHSLADATNLAMKNAECLSIGGEILILRAERSVSKIIHVHDL